MSSNISKTYNVLQSMKDRHDNFVPVSELAYELKLDTSDYEALWSELYRLQRLDLIEMSRLSDVDPELTNEDLEWQSASTVGGGLFYIMLNDVEYKAEKDEEPQQQKENVEFSYSYRELQTMLKEAREQGFKCVYPLNSKRTNLEEMYEDYCAWRTTNQYRQEQKDSGAGQSSENNREQHEVSWEDVVDYAVNKSYVAINNWPYRQVQLWLRTLRNNHWFNLYCKLNANKPTLVKELKRCLTIVKDSTEPGRRRSEERQSWWNDYNVNYSKDEANSFIINGVDIFSLDLNQIGWTSAAQVLFGKDKGAIKSNWRKLANEYHPDHGGDTIVFQQLNNIHSRLYELYR